jgi:hypothetical protein
MSMLIVGASLDVIFVKFITTANGLASVIHIKYIKIGLIKCKICF